VRVPEVAAQIPEKLDLEIRVRREITMPALGRRGDEVVAVPHEKGFSGPVPAAINRHVGPLLRLSSGNDDLGRRRHARAADAPAARSLMSLTARYRGRARAFARR